MTKKNMKCCGNCREKRNEYCGSFIKLRCIYDYVIGSWAYCENWYPDDLNRVEREGWYKHKEAYICF